MVDTSRIITGHPYGVVYPNVWADFEWVKTHEDELFEQYGECVILVYEQKVIGTGQDISEAKEDAERKLPADIEQVTPIIYFLYDRHNSVVFKGIPYTYTIAEDNTESES